MVNKEGKANWDIAKESTDTSNHADTSAAAFKMTLKNMRSTTVTCCFVMNRRALLFELSGLDHHGSGDFTADIFTLSTVTHAASASFTQDNIPYLLNTKTDIATDIKIDNKTNTYTFKTDDIILNNLTLSADGFIQMENDSTFNMEMNFKSPSNDFKDILVDDPGYI